MWFGGYTKQFTTVVWVGSPGNPYSMGHVFGGTVAAPIWVAYMSKVMQGLPSIGFPEPPKPPEGPVPSVIGMTKKEAIDDPVGGGVPCIRRDGRLARARRDVRSASHPVAGSVTALGTLVTVQISTGEPAQVADAPGRRDAWLRREERPRGIGIGGDHRAGARRAIRRRSVSSSPKIRAARDRGARVPPSRSSSARRRAEALTAGGTAAEAAEAAAEAAAASRPTLAAGRAPSPAPPCRRRDLSPSP